MISRIKERRAAARFASQLPDALGLLAGNLRSGSSFAQALQGAAQDLPEPAAARFGHVSKQIALGGAAEEALEELATALRGSSCEPELRMLASAVAVSRQSGGNLGEILDNLAETLRERARLRAELDALTAQGKLSGWIVGCLPLLILAALWFLDADLVAPMFSTGLGLGLLAAGVFLEALGAYWISRIVEIKA